jgi:ADP-heptose:LPS heptosyltransferase
VCYNRRVPENGTPLPQHTVDRMLCVLEPLGVPAVRNMRLYAPHASTLWWKSQREALGLKEGSPYAVIAPGSRWLSKRWPIERFAELIEPLIRRGFAKVIVIGSAPEREQMAPLLGTMTNDELRMTNGDATDTDSSLVTRHSSFLTDLVGRTTIAQTMAIVAGAEIVIANDSAPLHMAVGFDRQCIGLFGPTDPEMVGPYGRAECVVRAYAAPNQAGAVQPNFKDEKLGDSLMRLISTAMVLQSIDRVLALWPQRGTCVGNQVLGVRGERAAQALSPDHISSSVGRGLEPKAAT